MPCRCDPWVRLDNAGIPPPPLRAHFRIGGFTWGTVSCAPEHTGRKMVVRYAGTDGMVHQRDVSGSEASLVRHARWWRREARKQKP